MNGIKAIRTQLGLTQQAFAEGIGVSQGNVSFLERGQTVMPDVARRVIDLAERSGFRCSFDDVYCEAPKLKKAKGAPPIPAAEAATTGEG